MILLCFLFVNPRQLRGKPSGIFSMIFNCVTTAKLITSVIESRRFSATLLNLAFSSPGKTTCRFSDRSLSFMTRRCITLIYTLSTANILEKVWKYTHHQEL